MIERLVEYYSVVYDDYLWHRINTTIGDDIDCDTIVEKFINSQNFSEVDFF